jgi:NAD(P)H-dependent FMN reductase
MPTVLGLSGSLRAKSFNTALLRAAVALSPPGLTIEVATIAGIPLYDGDQEAENGVPAPVSALKERIAVADALLLVTPEYNGSIPGVMKNAIDWLSRPPKDIARVFGGKPVALIGATPGRAGTRLSQTAWLPVLRALGTAPWYGKSLYLDGASRVFDDAGELADEGIKRLLEEYLAAFARHLG